MIRADAPAETNDDDDRGPRATALAFLDRINAHDVDGIVGLLSDEYQFVNSSGDQFSGRQFMRETWADQFAKHPDFRIRVQTTIADEQGVAIFGFAEGTYAPDGGELREENKWSVPAAYLLMAAGGKVTYFETYSDASMVYDLMQGEGGGDA